MRGRLFQERRAVQFVKSRITTGSCLFCAIGLDEDARGLGEILDFDLTHSWNVLHIELDVIAVENS